MTGDEGTEVGNRGNAGQVGAGMVSVAQELVLDDKKMEILV